MGPEINKIQYLYWYLIFEQNTWSKIGEKILKDNFEILYKENQNAIK